MQGLHQLIPESRIATILAQTGRASERRRRLPAESVIWQVIAIALFAADSIPKAWRRLHPGTDQPVPAESGAKSVDSSDERDSMLRVAAVPDIPAG